MPAAPNPRGLSSHLLHPHRNESSASSSPVHLSQASSQPSRNPSPLPPQTSPYHQHAPNEEAEEEEFLDDWVNDEDPEMPSDMRPPYARPNDGKSHTPLLNSGDGAANEQNGYSTSPSDRPPQPVRKKSTFKNRDPEAAAAAATRKRYMLAGGFLIISLISFTVQTETAVYIKKYLGWSKSYSMLYATHCSWIVLWFIQLGILRVHKWNMPWAAFWRRHVQIITQTAQMVQHQDIHAPSLYVGSPWPYYVRTIAGVTSALTVAGGSWYIAVSMTTASDLTAIYNCSAFFAYVFSVPLLGEKLHWNKVAAVAVAIVGVLIVAYGDTGHPKHGSHSGGGVGGSPGDDDGEDNTADNRALGNLLIGIGSVLYGLYEVLYKRMLCPPAETSPGRSMIFANFVASSLALFTLCVLWVPIPILHFTGIEEFEWPSMHVQGWLLVSTLGNAVFSGSFLVLISLTSPVLSSVAALLTIFLVAIVDQLLPPPLHNDLAPAAWIGGILIIIAFLVLSYATYREMDEERRKKSDEVDDSEMEDEYDE